MEENDGTRRPLCLMPERIFAIGEALRHCVSGEALSR